MKRFLCAFLVALLAVSQPVCAKQVRIDEFQGLYRNPSADKAPDGAHVQFDNVYVNDGNIQVVKGRDKLNSTAHADAVVNGFFYYENSGGTKKLIVRESDEVVSYAIDGTGRASIQGTLTNEVCDFTQIGDTLYMNSATDGLYKWTGSGSMSQVTAVAAPSTVDFSSAAAAGGMTPGENGVATADVVAAGSSQSWRGYDGDGDCATNMYVITDGTSTEQIAATDTTYSYKVTKHSSVIGIESEPSTVDSCTLAGGSTYTVIQDDSFPWWSGVSCAGTTYIRYENASIIVTGRKTSSAGTLIAAPSSPFNEYCIYRTVAGGKNYFKVGCQDTGAYADGKPDVSLGDPLDTTVDTVTPSSFPYLASYLGALFTAEKNTIAFSRLPVDAVTDADKYWLATDKINLSSSKIITALYATKEYLLAFTGDSIEAIRGFGITTLDLSTLVKGVGAVSKDAIVRDNDGAIFFFAGAQGVYRLSVGELAISSKKQVAIDRRRAQLEKISSPMLDSVFRGDDSQIDLDPVDYTSAQAYYDTDRNLFFLFISEHGFIYNSTNATWSHIPGVKVSGALYQKSINAAGQGILVDDLGFFYNNWTGYENGAESGTVTGNPTGSANTTLTDTGATFYTTGDGLAGSWVIAHTDGTYQYRQIASNTATVITIGTAWTTNPTTSYDYFVDYIIPNIETRQYSFMVPPKETVIKAIDIIHNKSAAAQSLILEVFPNKSTTPTESDPINLATNFWDRPVVTEKGMWVQLGLRTNVYNTSNTIVPPLDLISYGFEAYGKDEA